MTWRVSEAHLGSLIQGYRKAYIGDSSGFRNMTARDRALLGELAEQRITRIDRAGEVNRDFGDWLMRGLASEGECEQDGVKVNQYAGVSMGSKERYGNFTSLCYHFMRDWSSAGQHVQQGVYGLIVATLRERLPLIEGKVPSVLVPGAGLCRLSWDIAGAGFEVEANEYSPLFTTVADFVLNRASSQQSLCPIAHLFSENFSLDNQFFECSVPDPLPSASPARPLSLTVGDFVQLYSTAGPAYRRFDAIVTCFFLDTCEDIMVYLALLSGLLTTGGIWVNLGPLNYTSKSRLKLNWDEIKVVAQNLGFKWEQESTVDTAYSLAAGIKMYAEQYHTVFSVAIKQ